jgi:hypothetical protein
MGDKKLSAGTIIFYFDGRERDLKKKTNKFFGLFKHEFDKSDNCDD